MALQELHIHQTHFLFNDGLLPGFSPDLFKKPTSQSVHNQLGRGTAWLLQYQGEHLVWRHCRRGGMIRHLVKDTYLYNGLARTRVWREAHLLMEMRGWGLPVPEFAAARCHVHWGWRYSADLITRQIPATRTLAEYLKGANLPERTWRDLGKVIAKFHGRGVCHADLNANNILLDDDDRVYLIDFDKALVRKPEAAWQKANLARLLRSLTKQKSLYAAFAFDDKDWQVLLAGYAR